MYRLDEEEKLRVPIKTVVGFNNVHASHKNTLFSEHPESADRICRIKEVLTSSGLLDECELLSDFLELDETDLSQTHSLEYVKKIHTAPFKDQQKLNEFCEQFDSVFMAEGSLNAAKQGVACCRELAERVYESKATNAFAVVRPPGHHADAHQANGFCLLNNAAQAAEAAFNAGADRILIVDLDVHHGQGTQRIFYDDKRVLYFSIHRYENGGFWPHLPESNFDHVGEGPGVGYTANVPLNETGCGDADYIVILWNVLMPLALQFDPQFVIISAGFDSCVGDPVGGMNLTPDGYSHVVYQMKTLAQGKMLMILEGGYNHEVSAQAAHRCLRVLQGNPPFAIDVSAAIKESTVASCISLMSVLRNYWTCFDFYATRPTTRTSTWDVFNPACSLVVPPSDQKNTQDVDQNSLPKYEKPYKDSKATQTLIFYDEENRLHENVDKVHPEKPARTERILAKLKESGLLDSGKCVSRRNERLATDEEIELAHERPLIDRWKRTLTMSDDELLAEENEMDSIFITKDSFPVACRAAGAVLQCIDDVFAASAGERNAFAVIRPPGHHASSSTSSGFCLFNNAGIGARYAMQKYGVQRVLILDWDIHHGNGTQEIFYEDRKVLYMSIHRHDGGAFYPMGEPKDCIDVGEGDGVGFSVNMPFSGGKMGDLEYRAAFHKVVMPIAYEFNPELVIISSGFDAASGDPLGEYKVSPETFALMTYEIGALASGRTIAVLEGGYNLAAIAECALAVTEALVHRAVVRRLTPPRDLFASHKPKLHHDAWKSIRSACKVHEVHWRCQRGFQRLIGDVLNSQLVDNKGRPSPRRMTTTSTPTTSGTSGSGQPTKRKDEKKQTPTTTATKTSKSTPKNSASKPRRSLRIAEKTEMPTPSESEDPLAALVDEMAHLSTK